MVWKNLNKTTLSHSKISQNHSLSHSVRKDAACIWDAKPDSHVLAADSAASQHTLFPRRLPRARLQPADAAWRPRGGGDDRDELAEVVPAGPLVRVAREEGVLRLALAVRHLAVPLDARRELDLRDTRESRSLTACVTGRGGPGLSHKSPRPGTQEPHGTSSARVGEARACLCVCAPPCRSLREKRPRRAPRSWAAEPVNE